MRRLEVEGDATRRCRKHRRVKSPKRSWRRAAETQTGVFPQPARSLLHIDSSSPRRPILRQNPFVFLPIALLFARHTNGSGIKIFSPNARLTMRNRLLAGCVKSARFLLEEPFFWAVFRRFLAGAVLWWRSLPSRRRCHGGGASRSQLDGQSSTAAPVRRGPELDDV